MCRHQGIPFAGPMSRSVFRGLDIAHRGRDGKKRKHRKLAVDNMLRSLVLDKSNTERRSSFCRRVRLLNPEEGILSGTGHLPSRQFGRLRRSAHGRVYRGREWGVVLCLGPGQNADDADGDEKDEMLHVALPKRFLIGWHSDRQQISISFATGRLIEWEVVALREDPSGGGCWSSVGGTALGRSSRLSGLAMRPNTRCPVVELLARKVAPGEPFKISDGVVEKSDRHSRISDRLAQYGLGLGGRPAAVMATLLRSGSL